jgi:hypothetical protein
MTIFDVTYSAEVPDGTGAIAIPGGLATPHGTIVEIACDQAPVNFETEATTGQKVGSVSAPCRTDPSGRREPVRTDAVMGHYSSPTDPASFKYTPGERHRSSRRPSGGGIGLVA